MVFLLAPAVGTTQALTIGTLELPLPQPLLLEVYLQLEEDLLSSKFCLWELLLPELLLLARNVRLKMIPLMLLLPSWLHKNPPSDIEGWALPASENDVIVQQFEDDEPIELLPSWLHKNLPSDIEGWSVTWPLENSLHQKMMSLLMKMTNPLNLSNLNWLLLLRLENPSNL